MSFAYEYARPALAVDCVVFGLDEHDLKVLLIQRKLQPFQHTWALPGGFVHLDDRNVDPRSWCRFPILSGGFERELAEMRAYISMGKAER
jgi:hypothetical protein